MAARKSTKSVKSKSFAQTFRRILDEKADVEELAQLEQPLGSSAEGMTRDEVIAISLVRKAMRGDLTAAKFIGELADAAQGADKVEAKESKFTLTLRVKEDDA